MAAPEITDEQLAFFMDTSPEPVDVEEAGEFTQESPDETSLLGGFYEKAKEGLFSQGEKLKDVQNFLSKKALSGTQKAMQNFGPLQPG